MFGYVGAVLIGLRITASRSSYSAYCCSFGHRMLGLTWTATLGLSAVCQACSAVVL